MTHGEGRTGLLYFLAFGLTLVVMEERCLETTCIAAVEKPAAAPTEEGEVWP